MAKLVINSYEEFASHLGEKLGESDWLASSARTPAAAPICSSTVWSQD